MTALLSAIFLAGTLATPSSLPAPMCSSAPAQVERANFDGGVTAKAICTADCGAAPDVSCSAPTCTAVNQSCPGQQGYVTCGTTTTYCPVCGAECTEGQFKTVTTGPVCGCEDGMSTPKDRYKCIGGEWVYQFSFCGGPFCQGFP